MKALRIHAGPLAYQHLAQHGLQPGHPDRQFAEADAPAVGADRETAAGLGLGLWLGQPGFVDMLIGAGVGGGLLLVLAVISGGGMGGGDVKFAAALGFWLGWPGILLGLFIGFVAGGAISLLLLVTGLRGRKDFIPFGPFIALGAWIALLYGKNILAWYFSFLI